MKFYRNPLWNKLEVVLGVVMIFISILSFYKGLRVGAFQLGIGAILIVLNFTFWKKPLISFYEDHLNLKAAPLAPRHLVRFDDILEVNQPRPKQAHLWVQTSKNRKKVSLPLAVLSPNDRESLISHLRARKGN